MSLAEMGFWSEFLPGFIATLIGVALGIPAGLLIERLSHRQATRRQAQEAKEQLDDAIAIVRESVDQNIAALDDLHTALDAGWVRPDTDLSRASWVAVQKEVLSGLREKPALRAALVSFFEKVERLDAMNRLLVDQNVGVNASMTSASEVEGRIREEMKRRCNSLLDEARRLAAELP